MNGYSGKSELYPPCLKWINWHITFQSIPKHGCKKNERMPQKTALYIVVSKYNIIME